MCAGKWPDWAEVLPKQHRCFSDGQPPELPEPRRRAPDPSLYFYPKLKVVRKKETCCVNDRWGISRTTITLSCFSFSSYFLFSCYSLILYNCFIFNCINSLSWTCFPNVLCKFKLHYFDMYMNLLKLTKFVIFQTDSDMRTRVQIQFLNHIWNLKHCIVVALIFSSSSRTNTSRLTSVLGAVPCDRIDGQPGSDVARTDHGHLNPVALELGPQAVEEGLGGVLWGGIWPQRGGGYRPESCFSSNQLQSEKSLGYLIKRGKTTYRLICKELLSFPGRCLWQQCDHCVGQPWRAEELERIRRISD